MQKTPKHSLPHLLATVALLVLLPAVGAADCPSNAAFEAAYNGKDLATLRAMVGQLDSCGESTQSNRLYYIAKALYNDAAYRGLEGDAEKQALHEIAAINSNYWPAQRDLGDLDMAVNAGSAFKSAYEYYENALLASLNVQYTPDNEKEKPTAKELEELHVNTEMALALADALLDDYIPSKRSRNRDAATLLRGAGAFKTNKPIRFDYKSDKLVGKDQQYADELASLLNNADQPGIILIGHTDYVGSDAYNDGLSLRRAETVSQFLQQQPGGYKGHIEVVGKGKREPFPMHAAQQQSLGDGQVRLLNRRVEMEVNKLATQP